MNRRAIALIAKAHMCPTAEAAKNIEREGISSSSFLEVTGNTGIDTLKVVSNKIDNSSALLEKYSEKYNFLKIDRFVLATVHRRENFGTSQKEILKAFLQISKKHKMDILFPVHPNPNVRKSVDEIFESELGKLVHWIKDGVDLPARKDDEGRIFLLDPMDYPALVFLMKRCMFLMTDSGGLQEEAPSFGKKILVLRESTERPEGVKAGFSKLVGTDYNKIVKSAEELLSGEMLLGTPCPDNPYGDGFASLKILLSLSTN
jgi:UDP-N-acetylglucosamine 2-epimerase